MRTVVGLFDTLAQTREVIEALQAVGFEAENVSVISTGSTLNGIEREEGAEGPDDTVDKTRLNQGLTENINPRDNVAAPMLSTAQVAGFEPAVPSSEQNYRAMTGRTGVGAVGLHNALVGWGFTSGEVKAYETAVARGESLLAVEVVENDNVGRATDILQRYGAREIVTANPFAHQ